jgi:hypothetical protein
MSLSDYDSAQLVTATVLVTAMLCCHWSTVVMAKHQYPRAAFQCCALDCIGILSIKGQPLQVHILCVERLTPLTPLKPCTCLATNSHYLPTSLVLACFINF